MLGRAMLRHTSYVEEWGEIFVGIEKSIMKDAEI